jgi:hypothetical protein
VDELIKGRWAGEMSKEIGVILDARPPRSHRMLEAEGKEFRDVPQAREVTTKEGK